MEPFHIYIYIYRERERERGRERERETIAPEMAPTSCPCVDATPGNRGAPPLGVPPHLALRVPTGVPLRLGVEGAWWFEGVRTGSWTGPPRGKRAPRVGGLREGEWRGMTLEPLLRRGEVERRAERRNTRSRHPSLSRAAACVKVDIMSKVDFNQLLRPKVDFSGLANAG